MSRTYKTTPDYSYFRRPRTKREKTQNESLETDFRLERDLPVAKRNRRHRFIPDAWDDLPFSER
jgi:hypothetical protein